MFKKNQCSKAIAQVTQFIKGLEEGVVENDKVCEEMKAQEVQLRADRIEVQNETAVAKVLLSKLK